MANSKPFRFAVRRDNAREEEYTKVLCASNDIMEALCAFDPAVSQSDGVILKPATWGRERTIVVCMIYGVVQRYVVTPIFEGEE